MNTTNNPPLTVSHLSTHDADETRMFGKPHTIAASFIPISYNFMHYNCNTITQKFDNTSYNTTVQLQLWNRHGATTSVYFSETTRRCRPMPESSHLHNRRRENLKSHTVLLFSADSTKKNYSVCNWLTSYEPLEVSSSSYVRPSIRTIGDYLHRSPAWKHIYR
jgi:hypothetical protein